MRTQQKAEKLYKKVRTFFLTCVGEGGYPLTKAVVPGKHRESLKELFFCTNTSSKFAAAIAKEQKGNVYFYSRKLLIWKGCMLKGNFEIVDDMAVKQRYWQNMYKNAYPERSYTDPDFCVVKFTPTSGRFYANFNVEDFTAE